MNLPVSAHEMVEIASDSVAKFSSGAELYILPMFWAQEGWIAPDPASTQFAMLVYELPLPPVTGFGACLSTRCCPNDDRCDGVLPLSKCWSRDEGSGSAGIR